MYVSLYLRQAGFVGTEVGLWTELSSSCENEMCVVISLLTVLRLRLHISVMLDRLSDSVTKSVYSLSVQDHGPPHAFPAKPWHNRNDTSIAMTCGHEWK